MLDTRKSKTYNENHVATVLGPGTAVGGEIRAKGTIRIEGTVEGGVSCNDSVVLLPDGRILGDVTAGQVIISGEVRGTVTAEDRIEVKTGGRVTGDLCAPRISIQEGVTFEGRCVMKPQPPQKG